MLALQLLLGTVAFGRNALFYTLVFLHALAALAGFGSIGFAGTYASGAYLPDDRPGADLEPASDGPGAPYGAAHAKTASAPAQPASGPAQPGGGQLGDAQLGGGQLGAGQVRPSEGVAPESAPAVPDYETALRQYNAALREFETSDLDDEPPGMPAAARPSGAAPSPTEGAPGGEEVVDKVVVDKVVVDKVVVDEVVVDKVVVVEPARSASSDAVGQEGRQGPEMDAEAEEMRRYFAHPARLWGCLVLVPFLGAGALAAEPNGKGFDQPWVFGALAVWLAATLIAGSLVVPSLHQMQAVLLKSDDAGASPAVRSSLAVRFARAGRIASRSAAFCDVLFLVALGLMIFRP